MLYSNDEIVEPPAGAGGSLKQRDLPRLMALSYPGLSQGFQFAGL